MGADVNLVNNALAVALCAFAAVASAEERSVRAVRLDGTTVIGEWRGSPGSGELRLRTAEGEVTLPTDDLSSVAFSAPLAGPPPRPPEPAPPDGQAAAATSPKASWGQVVFHLADGGRLRGAIVRGATDAVVTQTVLGDSVTFGWDRLSGIQLAEGAMFRRADQLFKEALADRLPGQDVLISRDAVEVKKLNGRLESLDAEGGSFVFAGESRKFQNDRIFGIVFAAGAINPTVYPLSVQLADASAFSGTLERAEAQTLRVSTSVGAAVDVPIADVMTLRFRGDRLVYVSDLKPVGERVEGILHAAWPVGRDKSVSGEHLSICGQRFEKGLGVHSRTELSYALNGDFEKFAATIGIDDAVRPLGSVIMRVTGDSKVLFDGGEIDGTQAARDIIVDVTSVRMLTLTVDYGNGLDASDHADWGDARLIRPRGGKAPAPARKP